MERSVVAIDMCLRVLGNEKLCVRKVSGRFLLEERGEQAYC